MITYEGLEYKVNALESSLAAANELARGLERERDAALKAWRGCESQLSEALALNERLKVELFVIFDNHESWDSDTWDSVERVWRDNLTPSSGTSATDEGGVA